MSFVTFVFLGVVWLSNGSVDQPVVMTETSTTACENDYKDFVSGVELRNAKSPPTMRIGYAAMCIRVLSSSEKKEAQWLPSQKS